MVYTTNIAEYKRAVEALWKSVEEFSKAFLHSTPDTVSIATLKDGRFIEVSDSFLRLMRTSRAELIGRTAFDIGFWLKAEDRERMVRILREHGTVRDLEINFRSASGEIHVGLLSADTIDLGGTRCLIAVTKDITNHKRAELALRESEEFRSSLLDNSPNPIIVINTDTSIRYVNSALENLTGFSSAELIGIKAPYPWWMEENLHKFARDLQRAMRKGANRTERLFGRKNGGRFWVEITSVPVKSDGELKYFLESWIDITEQKRLRENMQFYINEVIQAQEEERKRIARELHDETVQALARLRIDVENLFVTKKRSSPEFSQQVQELQLRIDNMLEEVRRLSHQLRPGLLDRFGLIPSLQLLTQETETEGNLKCCAEVIGSERRISPDAELVLFRVAQEALRNVRKHSKATEAVVAIRFTKDEVELSITDNGSGFEVPKVLGDFARRGKLGLVGIDERTRLINGSLRVKSEVGKGTTVTVEVRV